MGIQLLNNIYIPIRRCLAISNSNTPPEFYTCNFDFLFYISKLTFNTELIIFHPKSVLPQFPSTWLIEIFLIVVQRKSFGDIPDSPFSFTFITPNQSTNSICPTFKIIPTSDHFPSSHSYYHASGNHICRCDCLQPS